MVKKRAAAVAPHRQGEGERQIVLKPLHADPQVWEDRLKSFDEIIPALKIPHRHINAPSASADD
ncbi:hypothetical protein V5F49_14045 [Xanthobacter sp. V3C-3]|uniref:hypothetical protein n=1 Tax=Xanthobacter lutulentifluminis TaxID=3119935 RepID=UPI0037280119